ncbi:conjugal transfer protein TraI [Roseivirga sp. BDSF3-8]|uniref:conjugal transfer protein TraI n=1 Tax=Roseivirga sp. BDSF3-8 TaxID=3241598 RepID=UPI0035322D55
MKNIPLKIALCLLLTLSGPCLTVNKSNAVALPTIEIIRQGVKKAIRALDLKVQRLQNEQIWLQNAQKILENTLSKLRLEEISDWTQRQKALYEAYFQELWKVKQAIRTYQRVRDIVQMQKALYTEYQKAWPLIKASERFSDQEIAQMEKVYAAMLEDGLATLNDLRLVLEAFTTQMSDSERLKVIHQTEASITRVLNDLRRYNSRNLMLARQRGWDSNEAGQIGRWYE